MAVATQTERVQQLIDRLADVKPTAGFPVLSLYLDARPDAHGKDHFHAFLRKELKARGSAFESADRKSYERDAEKIQQWLADSLDPAANGVAIFACDGRDLFETVQLEVPIGDSQLHIDRQPHLYPLARVLDLYPRYTAVVTDTHLARIYVFDLGARRREATVENEKFTRSDAGGWSQMHYQRDVDGHRQHHAKDVMAALERIVRVEDVAHVVLSGDEVALRWLRAELPKSLQPKLVDMLQMDPRTPEHGVLRASLEALRRKEARTDVERVQGLLDDWRAGGLAVAGLRETEAALVLGEVHELLMSADPMAIREVGGEDTAEANEGSDSAADTTRQDRQENVELCDRLVGLARAIDARVHFVGDATLLEKVGGVAAALRYRVPVRPEDRSLVRGEELP